MIGETISHYKIVSKIGGSEDQGPIFKAFDLRQDLAVTLKFLPPNLSDNEQSKQNFIQEATKASDLGHPNIAKIYEINQTYGGQIYIASAFQEGKTLEELFKEGVQQSIETVVSWGKQLASALKTAHAAEIVHRDVKPSNVFISDTGQIRLLDFGLAKVMGDGGMTLTGLTQGTPAYMAPEQLKGDEIDARTDLWAVGILLYEALAGERPFQGANVPAVVHAVYSLEPRPLSEYRNDVPLDLARIVHQLLAKEPEERPPTASELLRALGGKTEAENDSEQKTPAFPMPVPNFEPSEVTETIPKSQLSAMAMPSSEDAPSTPRFKQAFAVAILLLVLMVLIGLYFTFHSIPPGS